MKKQAINYSWPATLFDFSQDNAQENFSRGKLRVFYKGETADHRYFSDAFAEEIIKSLPYTPVVSSYDEEKDDFIGHADQQQIFGIVDPCTAPTFETDEEGREWCVCEVVLYTERPDKVGTLAQKIVGQPQSLEMDPHSVKYVINYDEKKHFKNIEFTAGQFVGVSVLGKDQKPAFTGSAFFECNEDFSRKMEILRDYCEREHDQSQQGGQEMNLQEFMSLSWGDIANYVDSAVSKEYGNDAYTYVVDMFKDYAIVRFFYYVEGQSKLMKIAYSCNEQGDVVLGDVNEVRVTYVDIEQSTSANTNYTDDEMSDEEKKKIAAISDEPKSDPQPEPEPGTKDPEVLPEGDTAPDHSGDGQVTTPGEETPVATTISEPIVENSDNVDPAGAEPEATTTADSADATDSVDVVDVAEATDHNVDETNMATTKASTITPNMEEVRVENEQDSKQKETTSSTSFTNSEREEFETLKREKRLNLVNSYKENLTEEEFTKFTDLANDLETSEDKLELELLRAYKRSNKQEEKTIRAFSYTTPVETHKGESALDAFVRKNRK